MMPEMIANSLFKHNGKEYRPGDTVSPEVSGVKELMEKGFVVYRGGAMAAKKEAERMAAEAAARKEAEEKAAAEAATRKETGKESEEKPVKGRKSKVEE